MVKSLIVSSLLCASLASTSGSCVNEECEMVSALQMTVRGRGAARMASTVSKIMQALRDADNMKHVCMPVEAGEEAPVDGFFTPDHSTTRINVGAGAVADVGGVFCVETSTLSLLQRSHGLSQASDFEQALSNKGNKADGNPESSSSGKGGANPKPTPKPTPPPSNPVPSPPAPSPNEEERGDYPELQFCDDVGGGHGDSICGGTNTYGCRLSVILNNCGTVQNACCADVDKSCSDGDDSVKCVAEWTPAPSPPDMVTPAPTPATPPEYGELSDCQTTGSIRSKICWGTNQYGCEQSHIESMCGSVDNACCSDVDGSCVDGDDEVKCIAEKPAPSPPPEMPDYGSIETCTEQDLSWRDSMGWICQGINIYGCTLAKIQELCGSVEDACCTDPDGSCEDGDDQVRCKPDPTPAPTSVDPPPYGTLGGFCKEESERSAETKTPFCGGTNRYGCDEATIKAWCSLDQACCADADGSCEDGDDSVACLR